jgi:hypothetical protein
MRVLAFDIETLGRVTDVPLPAITCVCVFDGQRKEEFRFWKVAADVFEENRETLLRMLDEAPRLAGFNAVLFDLKFIKLYFGVPDARVQKWVRKCQDPFLVCRDILNCTCGLNHLLAMNDLGSKTGCGSNAIDLAKQDQWTELLEYCMMDAILTHKVCTLDRIRFSHVLAGQVGEDGMWHFSLWKEPQLRAMDVVWSMTDEGVEAGVAYE